MYRAVAVSICIDKQFRMPRFGNCNGVHTRQTGYSARISFETSCSLHLEFFCS